MAVDRGEPEEPARDRPGVAVDEPGQAVRRARAGDRKGRKRCVRRDKKMSKPKFVPKTIYITYIASTPEKVWAALTSSEFTTRYFFGRSVEIEGRVGGRFTMRMPDGRFDIKGRVVEWDPPRRLQMTWAVDFEEFRELPESLVTYEIEPLGGSVDNDRIPPVGCARRHPRRRPSGLAAHSLEPEKRARDRQPDRH